MPEQRQSVTPVSGGRRSTLRADCERCCGLCCVVPTFAASADFAIDKPAGRPCPNLEADFRCSIHDHLRRRGFPGCTAYDCFGAGQQVTEVTFGGRDWRRAPETAVRMFEAFGTVRGLHELCWYLLETLELPAAEPLRGELDRALDRVEHHRCDDAETLLALDLRGHRRDVGALLARVSRLARAGARHAGLDLTGNDLVGADFGGADLRGASLRGACLIGADLRGADLRTADLLGADLRGADLCGADLATGLFLTQPQINAAKGDAATVLPPPVTAPAHWPGTVIPVIIEGALGGDGGVRSDRTGATGGGPS